MKVKNLLVAEINVAMLEKPLIVKKQSLFKRLIADIFDYDIYSYKEISTNTIVFAEKRDIKPLVFYLEKENMKKRMSRKELLEWREQYDFKAKVKQKEKIGFK